MTLHFQLSLKGRFRRLRVVLRGTFFATVIIFAEAAFTPAKFYVLMPRPEPTPLLDTRAEILLALDKTAHRFDELDRVAFADIVADVAYRRGVDPMLILAVTAVESEFKDNARSRRGALGFMQLMRTTAFEWEQKLAEPMGDLGPFDWRTNIDLGAAYLRFLHDRMGSWPLALASYNYGPTTVARALHEHHHRLPTKMRNYERRVAKNYQRMIEAAGLTDRHAVLPFGPALTNDCI